MSRFETTFKNKVKSRHGFKKNLGGFFRSTKPKQFAFVPRYYEEIEEDEFKRALQEAKEGNTEDHRQRIKNAYQRGERFGKQRRTFRLVLIMLALAWLAYKFILQ